MVGYLRFKENFGLRVPSRTRRNIYEEYSIGQEVPIYDLDNWKVEIFRDEDIVDVFTPDMKPTTWEKLAANEAKRIKQAKATVHRVKAETRPVMKKVKDLKRG